MYTVSRKPIVSLPVPDRACFGSVDVDDRVDDLTTLLVGGIEELELVNRQRINRDIADEIASQDSDVIRFDCDLLVRVQDAE